MTLRPTLRPTPTPSPDPTSALILRWTRFQKSRLPRLLPNRDPETDPGAHLEMIETDPGPGIEGGGCLDPTDMPSTPPGHLTRSLPGPYRHDADSGLDPEIDLDAHLDPTNPVTDSSPTQTRT